jgi:hypothetical protein
VRRSISVLVLASSFATLIAGPALASPPQAPTGVRAGVVNHLDEVNSAMSRFESAHPHDWVGMERLLNRLGATSYRVSIPALGVRDATATTAQAAYDRDALNRTAAAVIPNTVSTSRIILSGATALLSTGEYLVQGAWNWDDAFVGMTAPADLVSLEFSSRCWKGARAYWNMYDYQGNDHTGLGFWYSANPATFTHVLGINDKSVGFVSWNDNGNERYFLQSAACSTHDIAAAFQYEHNQSGAIGGVSVSFGILGVSYSAPSDRMQKSTGVFH